MKKLIFVFLILCGCTVSLKVPHYIVYRAEALNNGLIKYYVCDTVKGNGYNYFTFRDTTILQVYKPLKFKQ